MRDRSIKVNYNVPVWNRDGFTKPNGVFERNRENQTTFVPAKLPPEIRYDNETVMLLARAESKVGELRGKGGELGNPNILIRAYLKKEAVSSSRIEGTMASLEDLNRHEAIGNIGRRNADDLRLVEVLNYVDALSCSLKKMERGTHKVGLELLRYAHEKLLTGIRGQDKSPGKFRDRQNWIVKRGTVSEIIYTPPPIKRMHRLLDDLEVFLQTDHAATSVLIQCAIAHYQLEAIHPFLDGNGRIGRLLLPLILYEKGVSPQSLLYMSSYLDKHKKEYYNGLLNISQKSRWREWIQFFLRAFIAQSDYTIKNIQKLSDLQTKYAKALKNINANSNAVFLMERLFENPYITIPRAAKFLNVSYPTAKNVITTLVNAGILRQTNIIHTSRVFLAKEIEASLTIS